MGWRSCFCANMCECFSRNKWRRAVWASSLSHHWCSCYFQQDSGWFSLPSLILLSDPESEKGIDLFTSHRHKATKTQVKKGDWTRKQGVRRRWEVLSKRKRCWVLIEEMSSSQKSSIQVSYQNKRQTKNHDSNKWSADFRIICEFEHLRNKSDSWHLLFKNCPKPALYCFANRGCQK